MLSRDSEPEEKGMGEDKMPKGEKKTKQLEDALKLKGTLAWDRMPKPDREE